MRFYNGEYLIECTYADCCKNLVSLYSSYNNWIYVIHYEDGKFAQEAFERLQKTGFIDGTSKTIRIEVSQK